MLSLGPFGAPSLFLQTANADGEGGTKIPEMSKRMKPWGLHFLTGIVLIVLLGASVFGLLLTLRYLTPSNGFVTPATGLSEFGDKHRSLKLARERQEDKPNEEGTRNMDTLVTPAVEGKLNNKELNKVLQRDDSPGQETTKEIKLGKQEGQPNLLSPRSDVAYLRLKRELVEEE